jgi:hypothetical protein
MTISVIARKMTTFDEANKNTEQFGVIRTDVDGC